MKRIFISYSHKDENLRAELEKHLIILKRQGVVDVWTDHCIRAGESLDEAISEGLEASDIILLLVSVDFLHSDYCYGVEMDRALQKNDVGEAAVVPIILRPCDWKHTPLSELKAIPADGKPVVKWPTLDDAFLDVVQNLRRLLAERPALVKQAVESITASSPMSSSVATTPPACDTYKAPRSSNLSLPRDFSDEERHDFTHSAFAYIQNYFGASLRELEARNPGFTTRMTPLSPRSFSSIIFKDGKRKAGCYIRIGGGFSSEGIAYSNGDQVVENSYNELLTVESDKHALFLKAMMGMFNASADKKLTEEGAAEHLWSMLISSLPH